MLKSVARAARRVFGRQQRVVNRAPTTPGYKWKTSDSAEYVVSNRGCLLKVTDKFGKATGN